MLVEVDEGVDEVEDFVEVGGYEHDGCSYENESEDCCHDCVLSFTKWYFVVFVTVRAYAPTRA